MNIEDLTSHSQIIEIVIESLKQPKIALDVNTFARLKEGICYGCVATNFMCHIKEKVVTNDNLEGYCNRAEFFEEDYNLIDCFESAIDYLRKGNLRDYDFWLKRCTANIPELPEDIIHAFNETFEINNDNLHEAEAILTPLLNELKSIGL